MTLVNTLIKPSLLLPAIFTQLTNSSTFASASDATPPMTKCHIEVFDAHLPTFIRRTQGMKAVKVKAESKCNKSICNLRLTVEIHKIGRFHNRLIAIYTLEINGLVYANQLVRNEATFKYCKNTMTSDYYGFAHAEANENGKHMQTLRVRSENNSPIKCGT